MPGRKVKGMLCLPVGVAGLLRSGARSLDPAVVNAPMEHVRLENSRVRVIEGVIPPGEKERMHSHPAFVTYVVSGSRIRNHFADGTVVEAELETGAVLEREPQTHWVENVGATTLHFIVVELKTPGEPMAEPWQRAHP